ncbi:MAG: DUF4124 domain-containing protein [Nitrospinae bacterium]|nr:DUF4124 domain-containing protein [Nitrospinota bacterium]
MRLKHHLVLVSFMMVGIFLLGLFSQPAFSAVYKWQDDQGRTHFTDDEGKIPTQYRNKDKVKKVKGLTTRETPKTSPEAAEESEEGEEGSEEQEATAEGEAGSEAGEEPSEEEKETLALLAEVKTFMVAENEFHTKLIEFIPADEKNGKNYILPLKKRSVKKMNLVDKMYDSKLRVLKPMVNFLRQSAALDSQGKLGGDDYIGRIVAVKSRIEREVLKKEKMIKILEEEIAKLR